MRVVVDAEKCLGYGVCESQSPELFELGGAVVDVLKDPIPDAEQGEAEAAIVACPAQALRRG